eukprot:CAMPEP_0172499194 /NCGR_PEP_ID=MMETSP1066-20121228/123712_1 /TAXON_ID=671091 /ORGANISM="Coscinodiscus wailesii, Strain CCMP2513" /LENGTH=361 /DNA_ID=CAMNT_0013272805 /DNA_START=150 /DNA_END=1232 /DNA_ORIENTATION=+
MATSHGANLLTKNAPIALKAYGTRAYNYSNLGQDTERDETNTVVKKMREVLTKLEEAARDEQSSSKKNGTEVKKLDVSKVAAAAGGGAYDEEADPLNAPEVLEAVAKFKKSLEERDVGMRKKRVEVVDRKICETVTEVKRRRAERKAGGGGDGTAGVPPPPPPPPLPSEDGGTGAVKDSGKRGVSNLPAWMTKAKEAANAGGGGGDGTPPPPPPPPPLPQEENEGGNKKRKFVPSEANRDLNARKQRLDTATGTASSLSAIRDANKAADAAAEVADKLTKETLLATPPVVDLVSLAQEEKKSLLKGYISKQIEELLGEEEATMISFIMDQVLVQKCSPKNLVGEMEAVLEEDAPDFVLALW